VGHSVLPDEMQKAICPSPLRRLRGIPSRSVRLYRTTLLSMELPACVLENPTLQGRINWFIEGLPRFLKFLWSFFPAFRRPCTLSGLLYWLSFLIALLEAFRKSAPCPSRTPLSFFEGTSTEKTVTTFFFGAFPSPRFFFTRAYPIKI